MPITTITDSISSSLATAPLTALLQQLFELVTRLSDSQYTQKPVGVVDSSVGGHVRHCLDHVRSLIDSLDTGELNYDNRRRGKMVESSCRAALEEIETLLRDLLSLDSDDLDRTLHLTILLGPTDPPLRVITSIGRELAYVLAHTVHHNALVGAMVKTLGGWLPDRFGYAPSTVKHLENKSCAR
ncbi:hypothetical protein BH09PLA1_BH09PLA1_04890 [soil metagenome]